MSFIKVDSSDFDKFAEKLEKLGKNPEKLFEDCAKRLATELLRRTMQKTPRDTSNLVRRWTDHDSSEASEAKDVSIDDWLDNTSIEEEGKSYKITVSNPCEYALKR